MVSPGGATEIRTHDGPNMPRIPLCLHTTFGSEYYAPHLGQKIDCHLQWSRSFKADNILYIFQVLYDLARVVGWDSYNLHELVHVSRVGSVARTDPAQPLTQRQVRN